MFEVKTATPKADRRGFSPARDELVLPKRPLRNSRGRRERSRSASLALSEKFSFRELEKSLGHPALSQAALQACLCTQEERITFLRALISVYDALKDRQRLPASELCKALCLPPKFKFRSAELSLKRLSAAIPKMLQFVAEKTGMNADEWPEPMVPLRMFCRTLGIESSAMPPAVSSQLLALSLLNSTPIPHVFVRKSDIDRFLSRNRLLLVRLHPYKQLSKEEKKHILAEARKTGAPRNWTEVDALTRQIAAQQGHLPELVRQVLIAKFLSCKQSSLFDKQAMSGSQTLSPGKQLKFWQGCSAQWMHCSLFDLPCADRLILQAPMVEQKRGMPQFRMSADFPIPLPYLLSAAAEHDLFCRYNYLKCRTARLVRRLNPAQVRLVEIQEISAGLAAVRDLRSQICEANLGLVLSMARRSPSRHAGGSLNLGELVSEGLPGLLRAIDRFDFSRGFKFSTYACRAIKTALSKGKALESRHAARFLSPLEELFALVPAPKGPTPDDVEHNKAVIGRLREAMRSLSYIERKVLGMRYPRNSEARVTLEQAGVELKLSKERIRQIQNAALQKLREALGDLDIG